MPDNKSISQLTTAEQTTSSDLFETSIPNGSLGYLSRKVSLDAIADYIGTDHLFASDLQTTNKTLTGAINEAAQSGGGGASIEEMTQAQYNALTPEQKADGTLRAISDATTSISDIDDVNITSAADGDALIYDSTSSKWINTSLNSATSPLFYWRAFSATVTLTAESADVVTRTQLGMTDDIPTGYDRIGIVQAQSNNNNVMIGSFSSTAANNILRVYNTASADQNATLAVRVLYIKSEFLKQYTTPT